MGDRLKWAKLFNSQVPIHSPRVNKFSASRRPPSIASSITWSDAVSPRAAQVNTVWEFLPRWFPAWWKNLFDRPTLESAPHVYSLIRVSREWESESMQQQVESPLIFLLVPSIRHINAFGVCSAPLEWKIWNELGMHGHGPIWTWYTSFNL